MYAAAVGKKQIGKGMLFALVGVVVLVAVIILVGRGGGEDRNPNDGSTEELRREYLASHGFTLSETSSIADVGVPKEFDERFTEYNEMLKTFGFDLEGYKGETVKKCTYSVLNRTELAPEVKAVLLIKDGKIIGGHLLDVGGGKLFPLFEPQPEDAQPEGEQSAEETILPSEDIETGAEALEPIGEPEEEIDESAYPTE